MQLNEDDMARLWDMLDAARVTIEFTQEKRFDQFMMDRMLRNAVERNLEIIGEAAKRVSQEFRDTIPEIPWKAIIALRNIIYHEYGTIKYERLWSLCTEQLAVLIRQMENIGVKDPSDT
ncbi:MAG: DUF86 domain-containing protein [Sedimentisphaerales bacterium]|nr:DUF86 domain-containing protein [Sedimentisphaerales bacterium]